MKHEVSLLDLLKDFKFSQSDWSFLDFRIDIDPLSFGSDATNRHTQYSNLSPFYLLMVLKLLVMASLLVKVMS